MKTTTLKLTAAAIVTGSALLATIPAQAWWGPFDWFDDDYYDGPWGPYGYGGPWGGYPYYGYPGYGYGYPGYGYPGYGYGYPAYGYGYPAYGYPYAYPYAAPAAPAAPASKSTEKTK